MHVQASYLPLEPSMSAVNQNLSLVKDCMLSIETCQVLIDQSIRHSGCMHSNARHSGIRHFGFRHSWPHPNDSALQPFIGFIELLLWNQELHCFQVLCKATIANCFKRLCMNPRPFCYQTQLSGLNCTASVVCCVGWVHSCWVSESFQIAEASRWLGKSIFASSSSV